MNFTEITSVTSVPVLLNLAFDVTWMTGPAGVG